MSHQVIKNKNGVYSFLDMPSASDLVEYYTAEKYYHESSYFYGHCKSQLELEYTNCELSLLLLEVDKILLRQSKMLKLLDIGCGEGFLLSFFQKHNFDAYGIDYSRYAAEKHNKHIADKIFVGDCVEVLSTAQLRNVIPFDVVTISLVAENLIDPFALFRMLRSIVHDSSILVVKFVNDFSVFQDFVKKKSYEALDCRCYPEHLHYFNKHSMEATLKEFNFTPIACIGGDTIEYNLLTQDTNYYLHKDIGADAHIRRMLISTFLYSVSPEGALEIALAYGKMGIGRTLTLFSKVS